MVRPGPVAPLRYVIVGNAANRRIAQFQQALARAGQPAAEVVPYADLLTGRRQLVDCLAPGTVLRIESPGEDFEVERALLRAGAEEAEREGTSVLTEASCDALRFDRGLILGPRQWYLGFRRWLRRWSGELDAIGGLRLMNAPGDIEVMFDKRLTHARCSAAGVPVPRCLGPVSCYEELVGRMDEHNLRRVFVKLANSSSGSGVVAVYRPSESHTSAVTPVEVVRAGGELRLYNSLKLRTYTDPRDTADVIDALCREGVHVEEWLPKFTPDQHGNIDLRVVVIAGKATHLVVRQSRSPLTNLHLGNRRGDARPLRGKLGPARWQEVLETCEAAMALFPDSLYGGVDVLLDPALRRPTILEVNAFGDLLPGVMSNGRDTYRAEIEALSGQSACTGAHAAAP